MSEVDVAYKRYPGIDPINSDIPSYPVELSPRLVDFVGDVLNKELAVETTLGNIPPEGAPNSLLIDLQRRISLVRAQISQTVPLSEDDVNFFEEVLALQKAEGCLPEIPEGFSPAIEITRSFQGAREQTTRREIWDSAKLPFVGFVAGALNKVASILK